MKTKPTKESIYDEPMPHVLLKELTSLRGIVKATGATEKAVRVAIKNLEKKDLITTRGWLQGTTMRITHKGLCFSEFQSNNFQEFEQLLETFQKSLQWQILTIAKSLTK